MVTRVCFVRRLRVPVVSGVRIFISEQFGGAPDRPRKIITTNATRKDARKNLAISCYTLDLLVTVTVILVPNMFLSCQFWRMNFGHSSRHQPVQTRAKYLPRPQISSFAENR